MKVKQPRVLTDADLMSPLWLKLKELLENKKASVQKTINAKTTGHEETMYLRGDLKRIEFMLSLGIPAIADVEVDEDQF